MHTTALHVQVEVPSSSTTSGLHGAMAVSTQACLNTFLAYINHWWVWQLAPLPFHLACCPLLFLASTAFLVSCSAHASCIALMQWPGRQAFHAAEGQGVGPPGEACLCSCRLLEAGLPLVFACAFPCANPHMPTPMPSTQAMSMLFTARPELIMQVPEVLPILESALAPGAPQVGWLARVRSCCWCNDACSALGTWRRVAMRPEQSVCVLTFLLSGGGRVGVGAGHLNCIPPLRQTNTRVMPCMPACAGVQAFKVRVLGGLIDLLRAEEEGLMARQQQAEVSTLRIYLFKGGGGDERLHVRSQEEEGLVALQTKACQTQDSGPTSYPPSHDNRTGGGSHGRGRRRSHPLHSLQAPGPAAATATQVGPAAAQRGGRCFLHM